MPIERQSRLRRLRASRGSPAASRDDGDGDGEETETPIEEKVNSCPFEFSRALDHSGVRSVGCAQRGVVDRRRGSVNVRDSLCEER